MICQSSPQPSVTADKSGVVTAGTILVLQKDGLWVYPANVSAAPESTYKNGKLGVSFGDGLKVDTLDGMTYPGGAWSVGSGLAGADKQCEEEAGPEALAEESCHSIGTSKQYEMREHPPLRAGCP